MDYKNILEKGKLIYASRPNDTKVREWRLIKTICSMVYYSTFDLTKLDKVILLTLQMISIVPLKDMQTRVKLVYSRVFSQSLNPLGY